MSTPSALPLHAALDDAYAHLAAGRLSMAETLCRQILGVNPREPEALHCLGSVAFQLGKIDAAIELVRAALAVNGSSAVYWNDLGIMLQALNRSDEAIAMFRKALTLDPQLADGHYHLANALRTRRESDAAAEHYRAAIAARPDFVDAHFQLGNLLAERGNVEASAVQYLATVALQPSHADALYNLGNARADQGRLDEALTAYRGALAIRPAFVEAHSNLLWTLQYMDCVAPQEAFAEAQKFAAGFEAPLRNHWAAHDNPRDPAKRLKVGYLSADFRRHSVACFAENVLAHHDRAQVETYCYYNNSVADDVTRRFMALADHWLPCRELNDDALAARIREDGIDILVDLAGHTAHHRLLVFARKPAPVQVTWLGYPATTGLSAIDYRFTDVHADPPGVGDEYYSERLARLPATFLAYRPPDAATVVNPPPALRTGHITFGSFNALQKITPHVIDVWSRILVLQPGARLLLKAAGLENAETQQRFACQFESKGIARGRVQLAGRDAGFAEHLSRYHDVDIALDPFPYNGTTTTLEAMWMGVPVVTLCGDRHASRVGASLLANAGLGDWIARNEEAYVELAVRAAGNVTLLDALRKRMRESLTDSLLVDAAGLASELEAAYRRMWLAWCGAHA